MSLEERLSKGLLAYLKKLRFERKDDRVIPQYADGTPYYAKDEFEQLIRFSDVEKAVRRVVSQIQALKTRYNKHLEAKSTRQSEFIITQWILSEKDFERFTEEVLALLVSPKLLEGSPSQLSKAEIEDVELSYKQIQEGKVFKSDNVEEAIAELKKEGSKRLIHCPSDCKHRKTCFIGQPLPSDKTDCYEKEGSTSKEKETKQ